MSITKRYVHPQEYNTRLAIEKAQAALSRHSFAHSQFSSTETAAAELVASN